MSRLIFAFAFLLMASTVSAQASNNVTFWTNSVNCGANATTDGLPANVTSFQVPNTCLSQTLNNGFVINVTSWCNNVTGVVSVNVYSSSECSGTPLTTLNSNAAASACNYGFSANNFSALVPGCAIAPTPTPTPTPPSNATTAPPTNATTAPPTNPPTQPTNGTTPKPGVATQAGVSFSLMAAAAAVIVIALF